MSAPSSVIDAVRARLETALQQGWATEQPGVPLVFANTKFNEPTAGSWAYANVMPGKLVRASIGRNAELNHLGCVSVQCMVPEDTGTKGVNLLSDSVCSILVDRQYALPGGGHVTTYGVDVRERGCVNGWYARTVFVLYRARVLLVR